MTVPPEIAEKVWEVCDTDGDAGFLTLQEYKTGLEKYTGIKCSLEYIEVLFAGFDRDGDDKISKDEFMRQLTELKSREQGLREDFERADKDSSGGVSKKELVDMILRIEYKKTRRSAEQFADLVFKESDKNSDGTLCSAEFSAAMDRFSGKS